MFIWSVAILNINSLNILFFRQWTGWASGPTGDKLNRQTLPVGSLAGFLNDEDLAFSLKKELFFKAWLQNVFALPLFHSHSQLLLLELMQNWSFWKVTLNFAVLESSSTKFCCSESCSALEGLFSADFSLSSVNHSELVQNCTWIPRLLTCFTHLYNPLFRIFVSHLALIFRSQFA